MQSFVKIFHSFLNKMVEKEQRCALEARIG
jgi:hypothetical protein